MTFTFPFNCKTRDGRDATILGYSQRKTYLIGFIEHGGVCNYWDADGRNNYDGSIAGADLILPLNPQPGKTYRTRNGLVAKINLRSAQQDRPLCGHVIYTDGSVGAAFWTSTGLTIPAGEMSHDLIEEITNES